MGRMIRLEKDFSTSAVVTFRSVGSFLVWGAWPVHCGILSSIPGLDPLDASSVPLPSAVKINVFTLPKVSVFLSLTVSHSNSL